MVQHSLSIDQIGELIASKGYTQAIETQGSDPTDWNCLLPEGMTLAADAHPAFSGLEWVLGQKTAGGLTGSYVDRLSTLVQNSEIVPLSKASPGDIILYAANPFDGSVKENSYGLIRNTGVTHAGIVVEPYSDGQLVVESKWSWGPVFHHQYGAVPASYGRSQLVLHPKRTEMRDGSPRDLFLNKNAAGTYVPSYHIVPGVVSYPDVQMVMPSMISTLSNDSRLASYGTWK